MKTFDETEHCPNLNEIQTVKVPHSGEWLRATPTRVSSAMEEECFVPPENTGASRGLSETKTGNAVYCFTSSLRRLGSHWWLLFVLCCYLEVWCTTNRQFWGPLLPIQFSEQEKPVGQRRRYHPTCSTDKKMKPELIQQLVQCDVGKCWQSWV